MANWKKVLVSGSAAELTNILATGTVSFTGLGAGAGHVLTIDAAGSVGSSAASNVEGFSTSFEITGSGPSNDVFNSGDGLIFTSTNGVSTAITTGTNGTQNTTTVTLNTPQDVQTSATPTFQSLVVDGVNATSLTFKDHNDDNTATKIEHNADNNTLTIGSYDAAIRLTTANANNQSIIFNPGTPLDATPANQPTDANVFIQSAFDANLFAVDVSASLSASADYYGGEQDIDGRGKIGIGLGASGFSLLDDAASAGSSSIAASVLIVSGNVYVKEGVVSASKFEGDGSGLVNVAASTLNEFSLADYVAVTSSVEQLEAFTASIDTSVAALNSITGGLVQTSGSAGRSTELAVAAFNNTTGELISGSKTFKLEYNDTHFSSGGGPDGAGNTMNNGSGSYYLYVQSASVGEDMRVFGDFTVDGQANLLSGFGFVEGEITVTSGSTQFGSGSQVSAVDGDGGHQFTGSLFITGNLSVANDGMTSDPATITKVVVYDSASGKFHTTSSLSSQGGVIGTPTDGAINDGFFDTFTTSTTIADAIDEISEAFNDLAPAKPATLTGNGFTTTGATFVTAKLAGNLTALSANYYVFGKVAGNDVAFTADTDGFTLTPNTSNPDDDGSSLAVGFFRIGKKTDLNANTLIGGLTASIKIGAGTLEFVSASHEETIPFTGTEGTNINLNIPSQVAYPTNQSVWAAGQATIDVESTALGNDGGFKIHLSGSGNGSDNGTGISEAYTFWSATVNTPSSLANTVTLTSTTEKRLSGVQYLSGASVAIGVSATNLHNPIYQTNNLNVNGGGFITTTTTQSFGDAVPNYNATLSNATVLNTTLLTSKHSVSNPSVAITYSKPTVADQSSTTNYSGSGVFINTYTSDLDTNNTNPVKVHFLDETYRRDSLEAVSPAAWISTDALVNGEAKVGYGRLQAPEHGYTGDRDYSSLTKGGSAGGANDYANYYRIVTPPTSVGNIGSGIVSIRKTNVSLWDLGAWGSSAKLQMAFVLTDDLNASAAPDRVFSLGDSLTSELSGTGIEGIQVSNSTTSTTETITFAFQNAITTTSFVPSNSKPLFLWVRFKGTTSGMYLNGGYNSGTSALNSSQPAINIEFT